MGLIILLIIELFEFNQRTNRIKTQHWLLLANLCTQNQLTYIIHPSFTHIHTHTWNNRIAHLLCNGQSALPLVALLTSSEQQFSLPHRIRQLLCWTQYSSQCGIYFKSIGAVMYSFVFSWTNWSAVTHGNITQTHRHSCKLAASFVRLPPAL